MQTPCSSLSVRSRRRPGLLLFLIILILSFTSTFVHPTISHAAGNTYYVNCSASSNGSGSQSSPWNTLSTVDSWTFVAGDTIVFQRGTTCYGMLNPQGSGMSGSPITIDAYGTGALPIIDGGSNAAALKLSDQQYWEIKNLEVRGGNPRGVWITGTTANTTLHHFRLINLVVHDVNGTTSGRNDSGLVIISPRGDQETLDDVVVDGVNAYSTQQSEGIMVSQSGTLHEGSQSLNTNVTIQNSTAHDMGGDGIVIYLSHNGLLQNNVVYNSGKCTTCSNSTPVGLWEWYCHTCTVQYNESYANSSWGVDGGDFDIDYYNTDNTLQYNYGHDSVGYCASVFGAGDSSATAAVTTNSIIRYNVCANNVRNGSHAHSGEINLVTWNGGSLSGVQIYNNTFYANPASDGPVLDNEASFSGSAPDFFKNNLIYSTTTSMISSNNNMALNNNLYYTTSGSTPIWYYNGTTYSGFNAYQSGSGQDPYGKYANPQLNNPTYHSVGKPTTAFTLQSTSPAIDAGVDVCAGLSGCSMGTRDFFGNVIPSGNGYDIGADESAYSSTSYNLVNNAGFESGTSGWLDWGGSNTTTSNAHGGNAALQSGPGTGGMGQNISGYSVGGAYELCAWARVGIDGQTGWVGIHVIVNGVTNNYAIPFTSSTYTYGHLQVILPTNTSGVQVYVWNGSSSSAITADDISLVAVTSNIVNGGFESGTNNWLNWGGTNTIVSASHSGSSALQSGPGTGGMGQDLQGWSPGETYTLSGWAEVTADGQTGWIGLHVTVNGVTTNYALAYTSSSYQYQQLQVTLPANTTSVQAYVWNGSSSSSIIADDLLFTRLV